MTEFLDNYLKALDDGTIDEMMSKETDPVSIAPPTTLPDDFEAVEAEEARPILGNVVGIGAEIGTGLYLTKRLHRSQQFLKWANHAKKVSLAGVAAPEPASSAVGLGGFALSEAAIWGVSNILGQNIRKAYGVQDNISAGEALASAVFGVGLVTKAGQKVLSLGDGLASMKAWGKGNELFVNGVKSFASGASLGIAETALRQEVQILLNERESRDAIEYLIGGAAGGGFNTMFDVFSRTGKWGQAKAKQVTARAKESLEKKAEELEKRASEANPRAGRTLRQEAKRVRDAITYTDDLGKQLEEASVNLNKPKEEKPVPAPKIYHGTGSDFNDFDDGVAWFTPDKDVADSYRKRSTVRNQADEAGTDIEDEFLFESDGSIEQLAKDEGFNLDGGRVIEKDLPDGKQLDLTNQPNTIDSVEDLEDTWRFLYEKGLVRESWDDLDEEALETLRYDYFTDEDGFTGVALWRILEEEGVYDAARSNGYETVRIRDVSTNGKEHDAIGVLNPKKLNNTPAEPVPAPKTPEVDPVPAPEPTPAPKTPEVDPKDTPFSTWQEQEAYIKEIGGLGINRKPSVDADLASLSDDALETAKVTTKKELYAMDDKVLGASLESQAWKSSTRKDVDDLAALTDKSSAIENEEFRRQIQLNIKEYREAQTDAERQETVYFLLEEVFNELDDSNEDSFKVAYFIDQIEREGLFNEFAKAHKRAIGERANRDPDYAYAYEEVFNDKLLEKFERGKKVLDDIKSSPKPSKENSTSSNIQGDTIEGPTLSTPALAASEAPKQPLTPRQKQIDTLRTALEELDSSNMSKRMPRIKREASALYRDVYDEIDINVRKLEEADNPEAIEQLLEAVKDLRKLNVEVKDVIETTSGRSLQASRLDASKYNWTDEYSLRSQQEDANLALLQDTLERRKELSDEVEIKPKDDTKYDSVEADERDINNLIEEAIEEVNADKPKKVKANKKQKDATVDGKKVSEDKASKAKEKIENKIEKLEKELNTLRERFGDDIAREEAADSVKPKKPKNPKVKDLEDRIKFYKQAESEVQEVLKLKAQLARMAGVEGSGDITLQRQLISPKPEGPTKTKGEVEKVRAQISQLKKRVRERIKEIDEAPVKAAKERLEKENKEFRYQLMTDIQNAFYKSLEADTSSRVTKAFRWLAQSRQLALINQLPSVLAGVPTGVIAMGREVNRSLANYASNKFSGNQLAGELAIIDLQESLANFKNLVSKDTFKAAKRTVKENQSATEPRKAGRMTEDIDAISIPRGEAALVARAKNRAKKALQASKQLNQKVEADTPLQRLNNAYLFMQSAGVKMIQGVDEGFKRNLILGRIRAASRKEALMELSELKSSEGIKFTSKDVDELAKAKYENALIDSDGLMVLRANHEYLEEVDLVRRELLFAANSDNIEDVVTPISEKVVQSIKQLTGTDHPFSFIINAMMPYIGVPIRGVAKGMDWMGAPIRVAGLGTGNVIANPYTRKIQDAITKLESLETLTKKRGDSRFTDNGKQGISTLEGAKAEILKQIEQLDARRIQYNADTLADAITSLQLMGLVATAAWAGDATGSMTFLSDDQKKKLQLTGTQPFKLYGMDYKAIGPAAFPMTVAGDVSAFLKVRQIEEQTGEIILDEEMSVFDVILNSFVSMAGDQPLSSGVKQMTEIIGSDEQRKVAASSMLASYAPVPAQVRKAVQQYMNKGRMADLKGSSFLERVSYGALGVGMNNYKTDYFGYDIEEPKSAIQLNVMRQWPDAKRVRTQFEEILRSDVTGIIADKPENLKTGIRMRDFVNERGVRLSYMFDRELQITKIKGKTMIEAVEAKIRNKKWLDKFYEGAQMGDNNERVNLGLVELNKLMRSYYDKTRENIMKDKIIINRYINKNNVTLRDEIEKFDKGLFRRSSGPINLGDLIDN